MSKQLTVRFPLILSLFTITAIRGGRLVLPLYALHLGAQPLTVGMVAATFSALPMLLAISAGKASDRLGTRWPLLFGIVGSMLGILVPAFWSSMAAIFIAAVMNGFAFTFYNVSLQNTIGLLSTKDTRVRNFANFGLTNAVGTFLAPLLVGSTMDHLGNAPACLVVAALSIAPIAMLVFGGAGMPRPTTKPKKSSGSVFRELRDPQVRRVLATGSLMVTGMDLFMFYMPIYGHQLGLSATAIGAIISCFAAAAFVSRSLLAWLTRRWAVQQVLAGAFALMAFSFLLVPFLKSALLLDLVGFLFGLGGGLGQPITLMQQFSNAKDGRSGEFMGMRMTVNHGTRVLGPLLFGSIGSAFGLFPVFWLNALMLGSGAALSRPPSPAPRAPAD